MMVHNRPDHLNIKLVKANKPLFVEVGLSEKWTNWLTGDIYEMHTGLLVILEHFQCTASSLKAPCGNSYCVITKRYQFPVTHKLAYLIYTFKCSSMLCDSHLVCLSILGIYLTFFSLCYCLPFVWVIFAFFGLVLPSHFVLISNED